MSTTLEIRIEVPDGADPAALEQAKRRGHEAAVLELQQRGELTIREAAGKLGLTYVGYLDLLHERGLPATSDAGADAVAERLREEYLRRHPPR
jgi:hypothetical protein